MTANARPALPGQGVLERRAADSIRGWAVWHGVPADLTVHVNGALVAALICDQTRPDLAAIGLPLACGFQHRLAAKLLPADRLEVRLPDGRVLPQRSGTVDTCTAAAVGGWAVLDGAGAAIEILVNDVLVASLVCARPRPDLEKRGLPLASGFRHTFTPPLQPGDTVMVRFADGAPLVNAPKTLDAAREGSLDRCTTLRVGGWAALGGAPVTLQVFVNDVLAGQVACDRERPDLAAKGYPPRSGFVFTPPTPLALTDRVSVRFPDGTDLKNSPRRPVHHVDGSLDMCSTARVVGWAVQDGAPAELDVFVAGTRVARLRCDVPRTDLATRGLPLNSGFALLLPQPAGLGEEVAVCLPDGTHLRGSPKRPAHDYAAAGTTTAMAGPDTLDLFAALALKRSAQALADGWPSFLATLPPGTCAGAAPRKLLPLGAAPKRARAAWHVLDPGGEDFTIAAPRVFGEGNHWPLTGLSRPVFLACLKDAMVRGRSAFIEIKDAALLDYHGDERDRMDDQLDFDPAVFRHDDDTVVLLQPDPASVIEVAEAFTLLGTHTDAFGHWMWEYLPKYLAARQTGKLPPVPVLIDAMRPAGVMPPSHRALLQALLPAGVEIIEVAPHAALRVARLWCAAGQQHMPVLERMDERFRWDYLASPPARLAGLVRGMAEMVATPEGATPERVFLARRDSQHRRMTNRISIEAIAEARGFSIVYPDTLDIFEQIRLIRQARYLMGPEGSAFFLGFFARPGLQVCILNHPHTAGLPLITGPLTELGARCCVFTGRFGRAAPQFRHFSEYSIDELGFAQFLENWLAGAG